MFVFIIVFLIALLAIGLYSPKYKGAVGEKIVADKLTMINGNKKILNNAMINDNGKSRQIDHILISEQGVFVIETKNYAGSIYGKETSDKWKQYLANKCFEFKNPIHQNYGHLEIVRKHIGDITDKIYPVVVFTKRCKLKVDTNSIVLYDTQLVYYINCVEKILSADDINKIYDILIQNQITDKEAIQNHNFNVAHYAEYKKKLSESGKCPRCNSPLLKKNGKNRIFLWL